MLETRPRRRFQWWPEALRSLRAQGVLLGAGALLMVMIGSGLGGWNNARVASLHDQARQASEVQTQALQLTLGMDQQQAGLRGYAISGDPAALQDYQEGRATTAQAEAELDRLVSGTGLRAPYTRLTASVTAWQSWAEAARQRVDAGARAGGPTTGTSALQGQRLFDAVTARANELNRLAAARTAQLEADVNGVLRSTYVVAFTVGPLGIACLLALIALLVSRVLQPLTRLSRAAERLAAGQPTRIPGLRREDEIGVLGRGLLEWVEAEQTREAIVDQSPLGIAILDKDRRFVRANAGFCALTGYSASEIPGVLSSDLIVPEDRSRRLGEYQEMTRGAVPRLQHEFRHLRRDGTWFWASVTTAPVRTAEDDVVCYVAMVEDVTQRREQMARAAGIQRGLLPRQPQEVQGYDLAGACRPAQEVGGDFFDWYRNGPDELTLSLGDVMGKGMPAAILMATARAALRTGARLGSVEDSAQVAADALAADLEPLGAFVTLFHARLHEVTGDVTFVDAGHGLAAVLHLDGTATRLGGTDFPVGIVPGHRYAASHVTLEPGDTLVVFSDGVLDVHPELERSLEGVGELLAGVGTAAEVVERLSTGGAAPGDDVTVLAVRRPARAVAGAGAGTPAVRATERA